MNQPPTTGLTARYGPPLPLRMIVGLVVAVTAIVLMAFLTYVALEGRAASNLRISQSLQLSQQLESVLSDLKDAETSQRGFLLTGDERYLQPFTNAKAALPGEFKTLRELIGDNPQHREQLDTIQQLANEKIAEQEKTIELQRAGNEQQALAIVRSDRGKAAMDRIRALVEDMEKVERQSYATLESERREAVTLSSWATLGGSAVLLLLITLAAVIASRQYRADQKEIWLRAGLLAGNVRMQGDQPLEKLCDNVLEFLAQYLGASVGVVYATENYGRFRRCGSYAIAPDATAELVRSGDSLLGQAAKENRALHVVDVPTSICRLSPASAAASRVSC